MSFDFEDLKKGLLRIVRYGGVPKTILRDSGIDEKGLHWDIIRCLTIIRAMTLEERRNPDLLLDRPRRERIAKGAAIPINEVEGLLVQRQGMETMFRRIKRSKRSIG